MSIVVPCRKCGSESNVRTFDVCEPCIIELETAIAVYQDAEPIWRARAEKAEKQTREEMTVRLKTEAHVTKLEKRLASANSAIAAMHDQAEDRCHRIGQRDAVTAWYLLAADTIDETMARLVQRKRGIVAAVTDGRRLDGDSLVDAVVRELRGGRPFRHLRATG